MTKENKTSSISQDYGKSIKTYLLLIPYKLLIKQNSLVHMFNKFASNTKGYYLDFFEKLDTSGNSYDHSMVHAVEWHK